MLKMVINKRTKVEIIIGKKYIKDNSESIKFYKSKNKDNYLIEGLCDYSEIAFIKKKY